MNIPGESHTSTWAVQPTVRASISEVTSAANTTDIADFTPNAPPDPPVAGQETARVSIDYVFQKGLRYKHVVEAVVAPQELVQVVFGETWPTDPTLAREAIGCVVRNRILDTNTAHHWGGNTYHGVINEPGQFDAVGQGPYNDAVSRQNILGLYPFNRTPYDSSAQASCEVYSNEIQDVTGGCLGFFSPQTGDDGTSQRAAIDVALANGDTRRAEDIVPTVIRGGTQFSYANIVPEDEQIVIIPGVPRTVFIRQKPGPQAPGVVQLGQ